MLLSQLPSFALKLQFLFQFIAKEKSENDDKIDFTSDPVFEDPSQLVRLVVDVLNHADAEARKFEGESLERLDRVPTRSRVGFYVQLKSMY